MASTKRMEATTSFCWVDGARPPEYRKVAVRDRQSGKLAEVDLNPEAAPIDPCSDGTTYVVAKGEQVPWDHPAVRAKPNYFVPVE